jgi:urease accessory protein
MLVLQSILGSSDDPRLASRRVERLRVTSGDAAKRRLRARTDAGSDVALDLPRGSYLEDGVVLFDDGERIIVVVRESEDALIIRLSRALDHAELIRQAAMVGHAFGNQHVPVEAAEGELRIPVTTSREIAAATARRLELEGAKMRFGLVPFGRTRPTGAGQGHEAHPQEHGHAHDDR